MSGLSGSLLHMYYMYTYTNVLIFFYKIIKMNLQHQTSEVYNH